MYRVQKTRGSIRTTTPAHMSLARRLILAAASIFALTTAHGANAATLTLGWTAPTSTTQVAGYELHYGLASGQYQWVSDTSGSSAVSATVSGLTAGTTYYFAVRSRNTDGSMVSAYSNEVTAKIPASPDTVAPTVSVSSSPTGPAYSAAQTVTITANATDNIGISQVQFYDGTTLAGTDTSAPFSYAWSVASAANGSHTWTAKAYDAAGNVATSAALIRTVNIAVADTTAPTVSLSASPAGPTYSTAQTVTIAASATDTTGVTRVEFYDGATLKGTDTTAPYSVAWSVTGAANGSHTWTAKAYDAAGNVATSAALIRTVNIAVADTTAPTVSLSASPAGPTYSTAQTVTIAASATDTTGVTRVEFYDGATLKGTDTTAPYSVAWSVTGAANGSHTWTAKAYDAAGNVATSAALIRTVNIAVADTTAPTVSLSASPAGPTYSTAQTVTIAASATDTTGVTRVEFYDGATLKGTDTTAPYSVAWSVTGAANGSHTWTAKAYDAAGNVATSAALIRTVNIVAPDTALPTTPSNLSATAASATQINLNWAASTDNIGVTSYLVERCQGVGCTSFAQVNTVTTASYSDTGLVADSTYQYRIRAADAAANKSGYSNTAAAKTSANPPTSSCTGNSVWAASATPKTMADPDTASVELGMKFRSDIDGKICGVRFYKGPTNTGTHVGSLWTSNGALLARATFVEETASGWQQVNFATPVAVTAGTVYVVSYLAPRGRYSVDEGYFTNAGVDNPPLHALKTGVSGASGLYLYGSGGFPTGTWQASNYWVDVVFVAKSALAAAADPALAEEPEVPSDGIGVYSPQTLRFYLDTDASHDWNSGDTTSEPFGVSGDIPMVGDWTGDGIAKIGVYRPSNHGFVLDIDGSDSPTAPDITVTSFGTQGDLPLIGDWNGDGIDEIGVYRPLRGRFYLDADNSFTWTTGDIQTAPFGISGDIPLAGDWNGDGIDEIGVYRPSTGRFYLDMDNSYSWTTGDVETEELGSAEDLPVVGDWNSDVADEIGIYRPSSREFSLDVDGSDTWTADDLQTAPFGNAGDKPVSGRWQSQP